MQLEAAARGKFRAPTCTQAATCTTEPEARKGTAVQSFSPGGHLLLGNIPRRGNCAWGEAGRDGFSVHVPTVTPQTRLLFVCCLQSITDTSGSLTLPLTPRGVQCREKHAQRNRRGSGNRTQVSGLHVLTLLCGSSTGIKENFYKNPKRHSIYLASTKRAARPGSTLNATAWSARSILLRRKAKTLQGPKRPTLAPVTSLTARPCPSLCAGHADVLAVLVPAGPVPP